MFRRFGEGRADPGAWARRLRLLVAFAAIGAFVSLGLLETFSIASGRRYVLTALGALGILALSIFTPKRDGTRGRCRRPDSEKYT